LIAWFVSAGAALGQGATPPRHIAADSDIAAIVLVKTSNGSAVIRAGSALEKVATGDRIGKTNAVATEITAERVVLDETFIDQGGKPNRARIVIKEGERGGTRYLQRPGEAAVAPTAPLVAMPPAPETAKPTPKKPPQM
jgi:hypothetical protein